MYINPDKMGPLRYGEVEIPHEWTYTRFRHTGFRSLLLVLGGVLTILFLIIHCYISMALTIAVTMSLPGIFSIIDTIQDYRSSLQESEVDDQ